MPVATLAEKVASLSPATAGFTREGGRASLPIQCLAADLGLTITTLLGTVQRGGPRGKLIRRPQVSHPQYSWMLSCEISNVQGMGVPAQSVALQPVEGLSLPAFALYPLYLLTVGFRQEPYAALTDASIDPRAASWIDDDNVRQEINFSNEHQRYTSVEFKPAVEIVTATYGFMKFRTDGGGQPDGFTFPGAPRVYIGKSALVYTWHFVPFSLVTDPRSPVVSMLGRINQQPFDGNPAGSLLYGACGVRRYVPPVPAAVIQGGRVNFSNDYVCDVQFIFELTDRTTDDAPTPANRNWLAAGHNLYPWVQEPGEFFYVTATDKTSADTDETQWHPTYKSFCFQTLWTDPAAPIT